VLTVGTVGGGVGPAGVIATSFVNFSLLDGRLKCVMTCVLLLRRVMIVRTVGGGVGAAVVIATSFVNFSLLEVC